MALSTNLRETIYELASTEFETEQALLLASAQRRAAFTGNAREGYDAMTASTPIIAETMCDEVQSERIRGWWVRPPMAPTDRSILFLHGGAYMLGSAQGYRGFVSQITSRTGIAAFALEYPLAPESPFPSAYDVTLVAWNWLHSQGIEQVAVVGDSAGAGLALAALSGVRNSGVEARSFVGFSPWVDLALTGASFTSREIHDPIFQPQIIANAASTYLAGADPRDGRASPLYAIPTSLPPILIQVGTEELLLDDARRYAVAAAARGGEVQLEIFRGLHHVFQRATEDLASARQAFHNAATFVSTHWR